MKPSNQHKQYSQLAHQYSPLEQQYKRIAIRPQPTNFLQPYTQHHHQIPQIPHLQLHTTLNSSEKSLIELLEPNQVNASFTTPIGQHPGQSATQSPDVIKQFREKLGISSNKLVDHLVMLQQQRERYKTSSYFNNKEKIQQKIQSRIQPNFMDNEQQMQSRFHQIFKSMKLNESSPDTLSKSNNTHDNIYIEEGEQQLMKNQSEQSIICGQQNLNDINQSRHKQNMGIHEMKEQSVEDILYYLDWKKKNSLHNQVQHKDQTYIMSNKLKEDYLKDYHANQPLQEQLRLLKASIPKPQRKQLLEQRNHHHNHELNTDHRQLNRGSSKRKKIFSNISPKSIQLYSTNKNTPIISPVNYIKQHPEINNIKQAPKNRSANKQYFSNTHYRTRHLDFAAIKQSLIISRIRQYRSNQKEILSSIENSRHQFKINKREIDDKSNESKQKKQFKIKSPAKSKQPSPSNKMRQGSPHSPKSKVKRWQMSPKINSKRGDRELTIDVNMILSDMQNNEIYGMRKWYLQYQSQIEVQTKKIYEFDLISRYLSHSQIATILNQFIASQIEPKRWILLMVDKVYSHLKQRYVA